MGEKLALVFDMGTQSTRAFLFNQKGDLVLMHKVMTEAFYSTQIGFAEKNTEDYWDGIVESSKGLKAIAGDLWDDIIGMSVTSIRNTYAFLDENNVPVRPAITWLDQRLASPNQKFTTFNKVCFKTVSMYRTAYKQRRLSPSTWMKENQPEIWEKTKSFTILSAYINFKLSGRLVDVTASQAGRLPYNYKKSRWQKENELTFSVYNVEKEKLCPLIKPGELIGIISREVADVTGIPEGLEIFASGSDKACETLGAGASKPDVASISYGTTATIQLTTKKYVEPQKFMPAYNSIMDGHFNPERQVFRGFWLVTWFKNEFGLEETIKAEEMGITPETVLDMKIKDIPAGSDGLMVQPYWAPGLKIPESKGTVIGFRDCHTKAHFYKAIIEGIGYTLFEGLKYMEKKSGQKVKKLSVSGGGAQSDIICQITADMFGLPVYRVQTSETSGLGASMIVFVKKGVFKNYDECSNKMIHFKEEFIPDRENNKIYSKLYNEVYKNIYSKLKPLYMKLYDDGSNPVV